MSDSPPSSPGNCGQACYATHNFQTLKLHLHLAADFGSHLADGELAAEYRAGRIDPYVTHCDEIVLDFTGIRMANSSFVNALVTPLVEDRGEAILQKLAFKGCNSVLEELVNMAIELGLQKIGA